MICRLDGQWLEIVDKLLEYREKDSLADRRVLIEDVSWQTVNSGKAPTMAIV